jgi:hypothetical protein
LFCFVLFLFKFSPLLCSVSAWTLWDIYQGWTSNLKLVWKVRMNVSATLHVYGRPGHPLPAKSMGKPAGGVGWQCKADTTSFDWTVE